MIIVVPDETRKVPLQRIIYTDYTIDDLFAMAVEIKRAICMNWTDESPSDLGMQLVSLFCGLADLMVQTINQAARECFIMTAVKRESMRAHCAGLQYTLQEASAAIAVVSFTFADGHPEFTIPAGTKVSTKGSGDEDPVIFETVADQLVTVGTDTVDIAVIQGETVADEVLGSSTGVANQMFYLARRPAVWQSEIIEVNEGVNWEIWTRVDNFADSVTTSKHYTIDIDNFGYYYVRFGNGVNGKVPTAGSNNVRATYRRGGGSAGNVGAGAIIELVSNVDYIESLTNPLAATGGEDQESIAHARMTALALARALDRVVPDTDVKALLRNYRSETYGTIAAAVAAAIDNLTIDVRFVPAVGGVPSDGFKAEIQAYLNERRQACTEITVNDPEFTLIDYDVKIFIADNYRQSEVVELVRQAIVRFGSSVYKNADGIYPNEFGADALMSRLYKEIMSVAGIYNVAINSPTSDITIPSTHIRAINSMTITASQGGLETSYTTLTFEA